MKIEYQYKKEVADIAALVQKIEPPSIMVASSYSAIEFAETLRIAIPRHPDLFREMAKGELQTNNLVFEDYNRTGDHWEFLVHFIEKYGIRELCPRSVIESGERYLARVRKLPEDVRIMSIVSREQELHRIFSKILETDLSSIPGLHTFRYYLERHIELDSSEGGHADLLKDFTVDDRVLPFYKIRHDLYRPLPKVV